MRLLLCVYIYFIYYDPCFALSCSFKPPVSHHDELQDEEEGFGLLHQLIQVWVAQGVVGEHVGHAAGVDLPVHSFLALCDASHALGHQRVKACVLHGSGQME